MIFFLICEMKQLQQSLSKFFVSVKLHSVTVCVIVYSHIGDTDQFCVGLCSLHISFDYYKIVFAASVLTAKAEQVKGYGIMAGLNC